MAKIFNLFEGDTWRNTSDKLISVTKVLEDGHILVDSPGYSKLYRISTSTAIYNINNDTYKNYMSAIPDTFIVCATNTPQKGKTEYTLCRSLLHKFFDKGLIDAIPNITYGDYVLYDKDTKSLQVITWRVADKYHVQERIPIIKYEKFVSIYNTFSIKLKQIKNVNKNKPKVYEQDGEASNPCCEIFINEEGIHTAESRAEDGRQVRLSSKIGKIRLEKGKTGDKIRFKRSEGKIKIPSIQWRVQHREICGA